jgi:hypothetical protein
VPESEDCGLIALENFVRYLNLKLKKRKTRWSFTRASFRPLLDILQQKSPDDREVMAACRQLIGEIPTG